MTKVDYATPLKGLDGQEGTLENFSGKVLLVVNTASKCGFTNQYQGLQEIHDKYGADGLSVMGFPCNQFGQQEPGSGDEIGVFCQKNYGVSFYMNEKVDVNGDDTHPLFAQLKEAKTGLLWTKDIKWNFTKFLIGRDGTVLERYAPNKAPGDISADIENALKG